MIAATRQRYPRAVTAELTNFERKILRLLETGDGLAVERLQHIGVAAD
jgi:hypothetical protein